MSIAPLVRGADCKLAPASLFSWKALVNIFPVSNCSELD